MVEEEVNYASVTFKSNKQPGLEVNKREETVYEDVRVQNRAKEQPPDTNAGILPDKNSERRCRYYQLLACCLGTLSLILVVGIIVASVYLASFIRENVVTELKQLKENQTALIAVQHNLTNLNNKLNSDNENLKRNQTQLRLQIHNLTQDFTVLEKQVETLTAENQNLTQQNEQLEAEKKNLTKKNEDLEAENENLSEQIQYKNTSWLNVSRAQWSIDAYCPKENSNRKCKPCQEGWLSQSSCYAVNNADIAGLKTWKEAQEDCRRKISDLAVVFNADEKKIVSENSWISSGIKEYWIGLRAEGGKWKWVDGSDLTNDSWIQKPNSDGLCAISIQNEGFKSVSCGEKHRWICKKKSLSV